MFSCFRRMRHTFVWDNGRSDCRLCGNGHHQVDTSCARAHKIHDLLVQYLLHSWVDRNSLSKISSLSCRAFIMLKATFSLKARPEAVEDENARKPAAAAPRPPLILLDVRYLSSDWFKVSFYPEVGVWGCILRAPGQSCSSGQTRTQALGWWWSSGPGAGRCGAGRGSGEGENCNFGFYEGK